MEKVLDILCIVGKILHWCTGWLAHPLKGGCCETSNPFNLFSEDEKENLKKDL